MSDFSSRHGRILYQSLPAIYREQDDTVRGANLEVVQLGSLARYLDAMGALLDRLHATLDQRLADAFPDEAADGRSCQDWLIPYFARLLDVRLVSPELRGQRGEVAHAVRWRQGKGTLVTAEEIAESVLQAEVELQEGWRRVAVTPRVGLPLLPPSVYGVMRQLDPRWPSQITRHPGLPSATVDLRCASQAVETRAVSPAVKESRLGGVPVRWMQANPQGVPVSPGHFDDVSRRTPDLRTPAWNRGHAHPRRLLVHAPVPRGLFPWPELTLTGDQLQASPHVSWVRDAGARELRIRGTSDRPVVVSGDLQLPPPGMDVDAVTVEGLRFTGTVSVMHGVIRLRRVVATAVSVATNDYQPAQPVLDAADSLLGSVDARGGYVRLERCTVRRSAQCGAVLAHDSLFAGALTEEYPAYRDIQCCRVPDPPPPGLDLASARSTTEVPAFFACAADDAGQPVGPDAGALAPSCPATILTGAEDGGELGVYHGGRAGQPVVVQAAQTLTAPCTQGYVLRDLVFAGALTLTVDLGRGAPQPLLLEQVAVSALTVQPSVLPVTPARSMLLSARSCLFGSLHVAGSLARLEYCTALGGTTLDVVQASDCIFAGSFAASGPGGAPMIGDCLRYSRVAPSILEQRAPEVAAMPSCTGESPVFFERDFARALAGQPGCGVLHPSAPAAVCAGAEDGGEMGTYHEQRHCLSRTAVVEKLAEHLPVGMEPVLVPDAKLLASPTVERLAAEPKREP